MYVVKYRPEGKVKATLWDANNFQELRDILNGLPNDSNVKITSSITDTGIQTVQDYSLSDLSSFLIYCNDLETHRVLLPWEKERKLIILAILNQKLKELRFSTVF